MIENNKNDELIELKAEDDNIFSKINTQKIWKKVNNFAWRKNSSTK